MPPFSRGFSLSFVLLLSWNILLYKSHGFSPTIITPTTSSRRQPFRNGHLESLASDKILFGNEENGNIGEKEESQAQRHLRFAGVGRLYTTGSTSDAEKSPSQLPTHLEIVERLTTSTVVVVGLGGVGSWTAEALCRSGIGNIVLIDLDDICISNTNRQLHATSTTVGQMKLDEMKRRLVDINPQCNVTLIHDFVSAENVYNILDSCGNMTGLVDAMDGMKEKTALLAACVQRRIPIVTCAGAAGRRDPTKITVDDLTKVANDRLLASCRKSLRQNYDFERGLSLSEMKKAGAGRKQKKWNILAVYSTEIPPKVCQDDTSSFRRCDGPMGTACYVTGSYGFIAASKMVEMIANSKLLVPRKQRQQSKQ